jgi:hypothetical protein
MKAYEIEWTEPKSEHGVNWSHGELEWTEPKGEHGVNW